MGGRGSYSSIGKNYKWVKSNLNSMAKQIDNTIELDAMDKTFFNAYPNDDIKKKFTADTIRDTDVIISNKNGKITYSIYKKQSEYSKKYNLITKNVSKSKARDELARLLKTRYEKYKSK